MKLANSLVSSDNAVNFSFRSGARHSSKIRCWWGLGSEIYLQISTNIVIRHLLVSLYQTCFCSGHFLDHAFLCCCKSAVSSCFVNHLTSFRGRCTQSALVPGIPAGGREMDNSLIAGSQITDALHPWKNQTLRIPYCFSIERYFKLSFNFRKSRENDPIWTRFCNGFVPPPNLVVESLLSLMCGLLRFLPPTGWHQSEDDQRHSRWAVKSGRPWLLWC